MSNPTGTSYDNHHNVLLLTYPKPKEDRHPFINDTFPHESTSLSHSFNITALTTQERSRVNSVLIHETLHPSDTEDLKPCGDHHDSNYVYVLHKKNEEEDVSENFVTQFNNHIGNRKNAGKAKRLLAKMKRLGGLEPSDNDEKINIPSARMGFCILTGLDDPNYKVEALNCLLKLLNQDCYEKSTSIQLVPLAIKLMGNMDRELLQTEIIDVQIKIAQVYDALAESLQRHYAKQHINALTKKLKLQLIETTKALKNLNTHDNKKLSFYVKCALEGIYRLKDDRKELFELVERFYHALAVGYSIYADDAEGCFKEIDKVFVELDPHLDKAWYNGILILRSLGKGALTDFQKLSELQILIGKKYKVFNWKFTYEAMLILTDITLNGETGRIRKHAFDGIKQLGLMFPGIATFADCNELNRYAKVSPMIHFEKPYMSDPNYQIRKACIEHLIRILNESPDSSIQFKVRKILENRMEKEVNESVLESLRQAPS